MRTYALLAGMACLSLIGCANLSNCVNEISTQTNVLSDRIVLIAKTQKAGGGSATQHHWVVDIDCLNQGTTFFGEKGFAEGATTAFQLPGGIHPDTLAKLDEVHFFDMKSAAPDAIGTPRAPEVVSLEVHYRGHKHVVTQIDQAKMDDGFHKLWSFINDVQRRSTVLATKATPAAVGVTHKASQLGEPVSALTNAATSTPERSVPIRNRAD